MNNQETPQTNAKRPYWAGFSFFLWLCGLWVAGWIALIYFQGLPRLDYPFSMIAMWGTLVPGIALSLISLFLGRFLVNRQVAGASRGGSVQGEVTKAEASKSGPSKFRSTGSDLYSVVVSYRFSVGGQDYESMFLPYGTTLTDSEEQIKATLDQYPEGAPVRVYYDPQNPFNSSLQDPNAAVGSQLNLVETLTRNAGLMKLGIPIGSLLLVSGIFFTIAFYISSAGY